MDVSCLKKDELEYELLIRGISDVKKIELMRRRLQTLLEMERAGKLMPPAQFNPKDASGELRICTEKLEQIKTEDPDWDRSDTLLQHLVNRLTRLTVEDEGSRQAKSKLLVDCLASYDSLSSRFGKAGTSTKEHTPPATEEKLPEQVIIKKLQVPVKDWGVKFSGDGQGLSINAFLEAVEELRQSRNTTTRELFNSAFDLFRGPALTAVRALRREVFTWEELVKELRAEFEPRDYEDRLWEEIRRRTQGAEESIGVFTAVMDNYFHRLPTVPSEQERLKIIKKNMLPYYLDRLALHEVRTVKDLVKLGRQLEDAKWKIESHRPPSAARGLLEPDLSYQSSASRQREPRQWVSEAKEDKPT